ncbi:acyl carrier protein [Paenibacillus polymyxa]|uniref:acyl carrier protein n=1 Tax=Paenibacillus polymyxa TaxID=1406 RepID=UPI0039BC80BC
MNSNEVFNGIQKIIKNIIFEVADISPSTNLIDLGITSILFIEIIVSIELKFDIEFDDEDLLFDNFIDVNSLFEYVVERKVFTL